MIQELNDFLQCYREQRNTLYRDVAGLPTELMDWQVAPMAVTIGSSLLHVAGMEYLILGTLAGVSLQDLRHAEQWKIFVQGFPRELSTIPSRGNPVTHYLTHLQEMEQRTVSFLTHAVRGFLARKSLFYVPGKEFQDEFLVLTSNRELVLSLLEHTEYHRGQITLLKFLSSRLSRTTSRPRDKKAP